MEGEIIAIAAVSRIIAEIATFYVIGITYANQIIE